MRDLKYPYWRWQRTLRRLAIRYRKPYLARHTSVSWNLIIGRPPLLVAKEHGHRIATLFCVYAAWIEGALEADLAAIRDARNRTGGEVRAATAPAAARPTPIGSFPECPRPRFRSTRGRARPTARAPECLPVDTPMGGGLWIITH